LSAPTLWRFGDELGTLAEAVREGRIIAIPTESSYGLAVDPRSEEGVRRVYALKGREAGRPLPVVVSGLEQIEDLGGCLDDPTLRRLASCWPAALSLLIPVTEPVVAAAGSGRLAFRVPGHDGLRRLLSDLGTGLTATSANLSGGPALADPADVRRLLRASPGSVLVDDGVLQGGKPSTLIGVRDGKVEVLRPGRIVSGEIDRLLGSTVGERGFSAAAVEIFADESS